MRAPNLLCFWVYADDLGRNAGGADRAAALRRLFFLEARDHCGRVLRTLVFREFSVHRNIHGRCASARIAAGGLGRPRLGDLVWAMGMARAGPENRRRDASHRMDWDAVGDGLAGLADVHWRPSGRECARRTNYCVTPVYCLRCMFNLKYCW